MRPRRRTGGEHRPPNRAATVLLCVLPLDVFWCACCAQGARGTMTKAHISRALLVPGEGIEPPANGLQNRCSTAELTRLLQRVQSFSYSLRGGKGLIGTDLAPTGSAISRRSHASTPAAASACSVGTKAA